MRFGKDVKTARERLGWSQQTLSARSRVCVKTIGKIELGRENVSVDVLSKLGAALGLDLDVSYRLAE